MKKLILATAVCFCFITFSSFKQQDCSTTQVAKRHQPSSMHVTYTIIGRNSAGAVIGMFTSTGGVEADGSFTMVPVALGQALHCTLELTTSSGDVINILMDCNEVTMLGEYRIVGGTGAYSDLKGVGKVDMTHGKTRYLDGIVF